jgi:hypothetical protein
MECVTEGTKSTKIKDFKDLPPGTLFVSANYRKWAPFEGL